MRFLWRLVLESFPSWHYSIKDVMFELINEPGPMHGRQTSVNLVCETLSRLTISIQKFQPGRGIIVTGTMGYRCDGELSSGIPPFVPSWQAILKDSLCINELAARQYPMAVIPTFHYYEPRSFTNQARNQSIVPLPSDFEHMAEIFQAVDKAMDPPICVFGP